MSSIAVLKNDSQSVDLSPFLIKQLPRKLGHYVFLLKDTRGQYADSTPPPGPRSHPHIATRTRRPARPPGALKRWRPYAANAAAQASAPGRAAIGWPMSVIDTRRSLAQIGKAHAYR